MSQAEWNSNQIDEPGAGGLAEGAPEERFARARVHFNGSTLALIASFIAAIAVLYLLGLQNKPRQATATEIEATKRIDDNLKIALNMTNDPQYEAKINNAGELAKALMSLTNEDYAEPNLPRNPFAQQVAAPIPQPTSGGNHVELPPAAPSVDPNVRLAQQEFMGLRLQIVMMGATPSALINDHVVQKGTKFEYLVVDDIQPGKVTLKFTDNQSKDYTWPLTSEPQKEKH